MRRSSRLGERRRRRRESQRGVRGTRPTTTRARAIQSTSVAGVDAKSGDRDESTLTLSLILKTNAERRGGRRGEARRGNANIAGQSRLRLPW